jgi:hypothetical protein
VARTGDPSDVGVLTVLARVSTAGQLSALAPPGILAHLRRTLGDPLIADSAYHLGVAAFEAVTTRSRDALEESLVASRLGDDL